MTADRQEMPAWLADQWDGRIVPMIAATIVRQEADEKMWIFEALAAGATIDYAIDQDAQRVIFGVAGVAICEASFDFIIGIRSPGQTH